MIYNNSQVISKCNQTNRLLLTYIIAGFPNQEETIEIICNLYKNGIHIIELGIPSSNPIYNSKTLYYAEIIALKNQTTIDDCFYIVNECRNRGVTIPILLCGHYVDYEKYGIKKIITYSAAYGVNGFIVADQSFNSYSKFLNYCKLANLSYIPLIKNTLSKQEMINLNKSVNSFIHFLDYTYPLSKNILELIINVRNVVSKPIIIGVKALNQSQFMDIWKITKGILIGAALMSVIRYNGDLFKEFVKRVTDGTLYDNITYTPNYIPKLTNSENNTYYTNSVNYDVLSNLQTIIKKYSQESIETEPLLESVVTLEQEQKQVVTTTSESESEPDVSEQNISINIHFDKKKKKMMNDLKTESLDKTISDIPNNNPILKKDKYLDSNKIELDVPILDSKETEKRKSEKEVEVEVEEEIDEEKLVFYDTKDNSIKVEDYEFTINIVEHLKNYYNNYMKNLYKVFINSQKDDSYYLKKLDFMLKNNLNRPSQIYKAKNTSKIYQTNFLIKREDLIFDGVEMHNIILYCLISIQKKKNYIITYSKSSKFSLAVSKVCAMLNLKCLVYISSNNVNQDVINEHKLLGSEVYLLDGVHKDVYLEFMKYWYSSYQNVFCLTDMSICGYNNIIGDEIYNQLGEDIDYIILLTEEELLYKYRRYMNSSHIRFFSCNPNCQSNPRIKYIKGDKKGYIKALKDFTYNEGILVDKKYGPVVYCALRIAKEEGQNKKIVFHI